MKLNGAATRSPVLTEDRNRGENKLFGENGHSHKEQASHFVQFYDNDDALIRSLGPFLGAGLGAGEAALVVATGAHRSAVTEQLS